MRKYLKKLFLYGFIVILFVFLFYFINIILIAQTNLLSINKGNNKIVLGASRTECAIDDKYLNGSTNLSASADALFYSAIKLRILYNNNSNIDTLILSLDNRTLNIEVANWFYSPASLEDKLPRYFYYFTVNDLKQICDISPISLLKSSFKIPMYTLRLIKNIFFGSSEKVKQLRIGGYHGLTRVVEQKRIDNFIKNDSIYTYNLSDIEISNLNRIVGFCKSNYIELIFINPPLHPIMYNSIEYQSSKLIFDKYLIDTYPEITYLDFSNMFMSDSCYADLVHLNENGAKLFSQKLNYKLKNNIN